MKIYAIIISIILSIITTDVHAFVNENIYSNLALPPASSMRAYGYSSATSSEQIGITYIQETGNDDEPSYNYYSIMQSIYNDANGFSWTFNTGFNFAEGVNYDINIVLCGPTDDMWWTNNFIGTGSWSSARTNNSSTNGKSWEELGWFHTAQEDFYCRNLFTNFTATQDGSILNFKMVYSSGTINIQGLSFMGFGLSSNGFDYTSQLNTLYNSIQDTNNQLGGVEDAIGDTNDKLDNLEDSLTSETPPDKLGDLNDSAGWLPAGPVDSLLNLPFTMLRNINNNLGGSCQPVTLTLPYVNSNITLPCLSTIYASIDGLSVWINTISIIASGFILYSYLLKLYKWVDDTLTFRENNNIDNWGGL